MDIDYDPFEIAAHAASLGVWDWDLTTNRFFYSARAKEICGLMAEEEPTFEQVLAVTHPDDLPWTSAQASRATDPAIRAKEPYRYRIVRADTHETRWVLAHGEAIFQGAGREASAVRYIGTLQDITHQHQSEQALVESEARLRLAVEAGQMAVWEVDLERNVLTPSPALNTLFGLPPHASPTIEELQAQYAPGERERLALEGSELQARGETEIQTPLRIKWHDGSDRWLLLRARLAPPTDTIAHRVIGVLIDITKQKLAEHRAELIAGEMQHRVKNVLSIVQSIATQSFRGRQDDGARAFLGRLNALAVAAQSMRADGRRAGSLSEVVEQAIGPYRGAESQVRISGPDVEISSKTATALALGLYELCTNAAKYGALSAPGGRVDLSWSVDANVLRLEWVEEGGPPVRPPSRAGFGTQVLTRGLFGDDVELTFDPKGLRGRFAVPLDIDSSVTPNL